MHHPNTGFTLIELSVVLVIIALVTGGIFVGKGLLHSASLRSIITEVSAYETAFKAFEERFGAYPGDFAQATEFWGDKTSHCSDGNASNNGNPGTCNGNADGLIDTPAFAAADSPWEVFLFWQHLSLAEMIPGNYTGISGANSAAHTIHEVNVPTSQFEGAAYHVQYHQDTNKVYQTLQVNDTNIEFGFQQNGGNYDSDQPALTPKQAWNIDQKMDDGLPAYGKVMAIQWDNSCSAANDGSSARDDFDASYRLHSDAIECALFFNNVISRTRLH